eukprot:14990872-Alexandrium_andersonii.AAC.1
MAARWSAASLRISAFVARPLRRTSRWRSCPGEPSGRGTPATSPPDVPAAWCTKSGAAGGSWGPCHGRQYCFQRRSAAAL